jgi:hypothetical protein
METDHEYIKTYQRIETLLDTIENKINDPDFTKAVYIINSHHKIYVDNLMSLESIIIQSIENIPFHVSDTLTLPLAENLTETTKTSMLFWNGTFKVIKHNNYWLNKVFHDNSLLSVFENSKFIPRTLLPKLSDVKFPNEGELISLGEYHLLIHNYILTSNKMVISIYENLIWDYMNIQDKTISKNRSQLEDIKKGHGPISIYGWEKY